jgi:hypothetical protein
MATVTVASRLDMNILMFSTPEPGVDPEFVYTIVGQRDPNSLPISGWGLTPDVEQAAFDDFMAANPHLGEFIAIATQDQIDAAADPANTYGYELGYEEIPPPIAILPPVNVDVPFIWQEEQRMRCTMGNWDNVPTQYDYQWMQDDTLPIGANNDTLPMLAANDGHSITCVVTATNSAGSTEAPPSNSVAYTAPIAATSAELIGADFTDTELASVVSYFNNNTGFALGFDIVVDGLNLKLSHSFGTVADAAAICAGINGVLGTWLTASLSAYAPWQFIIHSNTTGVTSTIGYASAPTMLASRGSVAGLMGSVGLRTGDPRAGRPTQDVSLTMRLRQSVGAITVQGIDASGTQS